ncbi:MULTISPECIES: uracil-DNA glycosylase [Thermomonospora]|uniref:Uracil-DNA glycosylase n=1 Tax=Thermomonospora curvata (strain ATCC 19995 / DSM 43183 / JCM 3096 / KCTC 9072 / NBRC 15933 / NCIMB 10081 / Henssen B9) TaxID=471852 RepID=D1AAE3_THECD|nr:MULTISPECIES: uracil-DNA glycosylase [Thermomonospora]ACY98856.1 uracil-DNA glycosylase [Thermomonospora curvata DSM 43183]PKK13061.1 MAG: uracil-DNA glycosylase [Thermomonospora sp. CIF 1]
MSLDLMELLPADWRERLEPLLDPLAMAALGAFVADEYERHTVYPPREDLFNAFRRCSYDAARVLILGQDPYHGAGQAHGLSFSVRKGVKLPPSLRNIYKELAADLNVPIPDSGDLTPWAEQGVLLLNAVLTVREGEPGSHAGKGWEEFTDAAITALNAKQERVVFVLWGAYARKKARLVTNPAHVVLESAHPSPLSAKKFFGTRPFSAVNKALADAGLPEIDWNLAAE